MQNKKMEHTNHFMYQHNRILKEDYINAFLCDFEQAKKHGEELGIKVYLGAEIRFTENNNDYIVFGINKEMLSDIYDLLPLAMQTFHWEKAEYKLYLVIKNQRIEWLSPVSDALKKEMKPFLKCWRIPDSDLKVINEDIARRLQLID